MTTLDRYHEDIARIAQSPCPYPEGRFSGAGIVTCAGGRTYYTCAWVLVNLLRRLGCRLPIEVWYRGRAEMSDGMRRLLESVQGVRCMDAREALSHRPAHPFSGWELKPLSIINSRFEDVLFIDCDNVPTLDPSFLLKTDAYRRLGAIFWPDRCMREGDRYQTLLQGAWEACGVSRRDEPEFESGQMLINKRRCWKALRLAMFYNEHSDFFYQFLLGDKDTFHMAWRRLGLDFAMPLFRPEQDWEGCPVLYQHDFDGRRLFQHRNQDKWSYDGGNFPIPGYEHEALCFDYLQELRRRWDGTVRRYPEDYCAAERGAYEAITQTRLYHYACSGVESRLLEFRPDFSIGIGRTMWETHWEIEEDGRGGVSLGLRNSSRRMCVLAQSDGEWTGHYLHFGREATVVEPISRLPEAERRVAEQVREMLATGPDQDGEEAQEIARVGMCVYRRVGHDARPMELRSDHTIGQGSAPCERWWYIRKTADGPRLVICGDHGVTCELMRAPDGSWSARGRGFEKTPVELAPPSHKRSGATLDCYALSREGLGSYLQGAALDPYALSREGLGYYLQGAKSSNARRT